MYAPVVEKAEHIFDYVFKDKKLCAQALQMMQSPSVTMPVNGRHEDIPHNSRLAVLGDCVLGQTLCKMWFYTTGFNGLPLSKGAWDVARQTVLGNAALHERGDSLGIGELIFANPGTARPFSEKMIAATLQAIFGAIYLDGGEAAVMDAIRHVGFDDHPSLRANAAPN